MSPAKLPPTRPLLTMLIELSESLRVDDAPLVEKQRRDRQIAHVAGQASASVNTGHDSSANLQPEQPPLEQINHWLNAVSTPEVQQFAQRWTRGWQLTQSILLLLGLITGIGVSAATLRYDGSVPINIVDAWLVLVGLPLGMWLLWLASLLPFRLPIVSALSELIQHSLFAPLQHWLQQKFTRGTRSFPDLMRPYSAHWKTRLLGVLMQQFALGLTTGSLLALLYLLASSDLAFAWSTSLAVTPETLHHLTHQLALPFVAFFPSASPGFPLIEASQFFRLDDTRSQQFSADAANHLTQWWPFLAASIGFYAVLPRVLSLFLAGFLFSRANHDEVLSIPGTSALLARMNAPVLATAPERSQPSSAVSDAPSPAPLSARQWSLAAPLIIWGASDAKPETITRALAQIGLDARAQFQAGGSASLASDRQLIESLTRTREAEGYLVAVKAWEPPMGEFRDWLAILRSKHPKAPIVVVLLDAQEGTPSDNDIAVWQADLAQLGDTHLHIEPVTL